MSKMFLKTQYIHQITLPIPFLVWSIHVYLIEEDALTLVDTGLNATEAWEALTKSLNVRE